MPLGVGGRGSRSWRPTSRRADPRSSVRHRRRPACTARSPRPALVEIVVGERQRILALEDVLGHDRDADVLVEREVAEDEARVGVGQRELDGLVVRRGESLTHCFMSEDRPVSGELSISILTVKTTSFAVKGWPSLQSTPLRMVTVTCLKSELNLYSVPSHGISPALQSMPVGPQTVGVVRVVVEERLHDDLIAAARDARQERVLEGDVAELLRRFAADADRDEGLVAGHRR